MTMPPIASGRTPLGKVVLILAYLVCDYQTVLARIDALQGGFSLLLFLAIYAAVAGSLLICAFIRNTALRISLAMLFSAASVFQQSFVWTTSGPLTYETFLNLYNASDQVSLALAQHGPVIVAAIAVALLLFLGIALPPRRVIDPRVAFGTPILVLSCLTGMLYMRGGEGSIALPAAYPPLALSGIMLAERSKEDSGPREPATIPRRRAPASQDIVMLIDESIAGNYLDINNTNGVRSGLAKARHGIRFTNFGYAASIHNCSANSNVVLRFGGTQDNYRHAIARWPSIWAYAHKAGMRTVYIDGQTSDGALQNMMTPQERDEIDEFVQLDGVPIVQRDQRIADLLAQHINNGKPELIYVNKVGAHFPVADKFPVERTLYKPVLDRAAGQSVSWTSDRTGFTGRADEWVRYRNSYRNAVAWNVGGFFDRLFAAADLKNATILYTSDHGQDLHERHNPGNNTHCGTDNAAMEEGLVPLGIIESADATSLDWAKNLSVNHNASSDFRLFATALMLMGYDRNSVRDRYGVPLDEADKPAMAYNVDFSPLLGRKPRYRAIDVSSVVTPPVSDYTMLGKR